MKSFIKFRSHISKIIKSSIIAIIIVILFMVIDACEELGPPNLSVLILMKSNVNSIAQIYYDIGNGFNEKDSQAVNVAKSNKFQILQFNLPADKIYNLRFDPLRHEGTFEIQNVKIGDDALQTLQKIDLDSIKSLQQIKDLRIKNNIAVGVTTQGAFDPILYFDLNYPIQSNGTNYISDYFKTVPKKVAVIFLMSFAGMMFAFFDDDFE